jgi:hypothetical protein
LKLFGELVETNLPESEENIMVVGVEEERALQRADVHLQDLACGDVTIGVPGEELHSL